MKPEEQSSMAALFTRCGINVPDRALALFARFYDLLAQHNDDHDLSRLTGFEDIVIKHFVDSCVVAGLTELPAPLLDIGTGAGFPGIPLAIMRPDLPIILAEPRRRRVAFLELAVAELGLGAVTIYPHLVTDKSQFTTGAVITRALESAADTLARVDHFLVRGARVILMKGPEAGADIAALTDELAAGYRLVEDRAYRLGDTEHRRRLLVFEKESDTARRTFRIMKDEKETPGTPITSTENRSFKEWKRLLDADGIRKEGLLLLSGKKTIADVLSLPGTVARDWIVYDGYVENERWFLDRLTPPAPAILKKSLYNELDTFNTRGPLVTVPAPPIPEWDGSLPPGCTVAIPFQDPVNVGSAIRSAAGFGAAQVVLLREAAHPFHPRSVRASAGAVFTIPLRRGPSLTELAEAPGTGALPLVCLDREGEPLDAFPFPASFILLPGLEGPGLPQSLRSSTVAIPLAGAVESLNGPIALAVALYEWRRR